MASFGESLRRERELRGVTLAELAAATKISLRHLSALEHDQFDSLPGGVFNRGFVRAVARYLGLDEREWVAAFVRSANQEAPLVADYVAPGAVTKSARRSWTSFALLVVLFGAGLFSVHSVRTRRAAEALPATASPVSTLANPATLPTSASAPSSESALPLSAERPSPSLPLVPASTTGQADLLLQVFAVEEAWVSIEADGQRLYEGLMKSRETRVFRAGREFNLRTGNASAVVLTLNGETLAPLGNPGESKSIQLSRRDLSAVQP
jgi:cytoskeleton protein RodZ